MFEIHVGELRATFLRNHNMRRRKDPTRKTVQAEDNSSTEDTPSPEDNPSGRQLKPRRPPQPRQPPQPPQARGRCTRYVAVHPLRGGAPEQKRCIAYGSGALPQHTRTNAELAHRTTHRHTPPCAPGPYWRHAAHSDPLRHLLHPYMRRAGKDAERAGARRRREKRSARPGAGQGPASGRWPTGRRSARTRPR